ncbi:DUF551 domain-containing protein [Escherichia coli]|nr:DUF551 domain-containing protein [Escherichia coli]EFI6908554.1 DUF551 domain-containing protein [Escherichia coli]EFI6989534.1 DUF551 domain-containing protein [Escherichia coli]EFL9676491.1 DUF551 domain-containing protein [Escherichia coli]EKY5014300.1 DUF551 domain-containing protein [Escherichia coli]
MTTITKERAEIKSFITGFLSDPAHDNQSSNSLLTNVFRIALASLEAEPVAWECGENIILFNPDTVEAYAKRAEISPKPPYAASPVSVTPDGWISCSERMPDNNHDVLFFDVWGYIRIGWFSADDRSWFTSDDGCCMEVTHWMPLPEPPQEVN